MMKKYLLPISIILGLLFNLLFWEKIPGISFPIFVGLCLISGYFLIKAEGKKPAKINLLLVATIAAFSVMTFVRREPFTSFLGFTLTLFSMGLLAASYLSGDWIKFQMVDHIASFFHLAGGMISLPWMQKKEGSKDKNEKPNKARIGSILRGIVLSIPIWLVFLSLLYSADSIFANRVDVILSNLNLDNLAELAVQLILILLVAYFFSGAVLFASQRSENPSMGKSDKTQLSPFLGLTETGIILGGVILLLGSFVIIQFQYFFSGQANINLEGFTFAEYARRGFGELVGVSVLNVLLLKGLSVATRRELRRSRLFFSALSAGLVVLVLVILVSAFQRLSLYESAYGFTRLRTYSHIFMIWLGIYMLAYLFMEFLKRQNLFVNITLLVITGFSLTLGILGVDRFIVERNIQRAVDGEPLDAGYLAELSSDAVPAISKYFNNTSLSTDLQESLVAALVCFQQKPSNQSLTERPWQSFHLADKAALTALNSLSEQLDKYEVNDKEWPVVVTSPRGMSFPCDGLSVFD